MDNKKYYDSKFFEESESRLNYAISTYVPEEYKGKTSLENPDFIKTYATVYLYATCEEIESVEVAEMIVEGSSNEELKAFVKSVQILFYRKQDGEVLTFSFN